LGWQGKSKKIASIIPQKHNAEYNSAFASN